MGTPGGDGAISRLYQYEHPGCTAALQDVIIGGNGVKGTQEPRVISCNCIWLHNYMLELAAATNKIESLK